MKASKKTAIIDIIIDTVQQVSEPTVDVVLDKLLPFIIGTHINLNWIKSRIELIINNQ